MQAAIGVAQLEKLGMFIRKRIDHFSKYNEFFRLYDKWFILPRWNTAAKPSWFGYPLAVKESAPFTRDDLVTYLDRNRIDTRMLFAGNMLRQPAFQDVSYRVAGSLENTDLVMNQTFWLGVYPGLKKEELAYILLKLKEFFNRF